MRDIEYGIMERGEGRHIVADEPMSWCGRELIWLYPNPDSPGCPQRICARCRTALDAAPPGERPT
jgi:hypothetical protein